MPRTGEGALGQEAAPKASAHFFPFAGLALLGLHAVLLVVVKPFGDFHAVDGWIYARSVETLLEEGRVHLFDLIPITLLFHTAWGALFGLVFGYSQPALIVSVLVMSVAGSVAVVGVARELGVSPGRALSGAVLAVLTPVWTFQAVVFHTDVTFSACCLVGIWAYLAAGRTGQRWLFVAASGAFAAAFLVRQPGIFFAAAAVVHRRFVLLARRAPRKAVWLDLAALAVIPAAAVYAFTAWYVYAHGVTWAYLSQSAEIRQNLSLAHVARLPALWFRVAFFLAVFGLPLAPAVVAATPCRRVWRMAMVLAAAALLSAATVFVLVRSHSLFPVGLGGLVTPLGIMRKLYGVRPVVLTAPIQAAVSAAGGMALWSVLIGRVGGWLVHARGSGIWKALWEGIRTPAGAVFLAALVYVSYLSMGPWLFDRYLLPVVPLAAVLALAAVRRSTLLWPVAIVLALPQAWFSIAATQDYLMISRVVWSEGRRLAASGVPIDEIDVGPDWNAYHFYHDTGFAADPAETAQPPSLRYVIRVCEAGVGGPAEGEVARSRPFTTLLISTPRCVRVVRVPEVQANAGPRPTTSSGLGH